MGVVDGIVTKADICIGQNRLECGVQILGKQVVGGCVGGIGVGVGVYGGR